MKNCLILTGIFILLTSCSKSIIETGQINEFTIQSDYTGTKYDIWVVLPKGYNSNEKYETIYVLDANSNHSKPSRIASITENLSNKYAKQNLVVVGISSKNERDRDFTPTLTSDGGGGSENYSKFIEFELIPKIENEYSVDNASTGRIIVGHSYGGLLAGYFFTKHPNIFNNYIILSPSFWYDNNIFFQYEKDSRSNNSLLNTLVFTGCGEMEESTVIRAIEWNYRLDTYYPKCKHDFKILKNLGHVPSAPGNIESGLEFYFINK